MITQEYRMFRTVGKIKFSIGEKNLRLSAKIGNRLTFKGGKNDNGYFKSIADAEAYILKNIEEFKKCKSMNKLIYIDYEQKN